MSEPLARLYDLALRTLDDHERRADALRGRLAPTLAAAALGVTLLSGPLVGGAHPITLAGKLALTIAAIGFLVSVAAAFHVLGMRHRPLAALAPQRLAAVLTATEKLDDPRSFYIEMIKRLGVELDDRENTAAQAEQAFTVMLWGILVMLCGLAVGALIG